MSVQTQEETYSLEEILAAAKSSNRLILWNDETNTFDHVIECLMKHLQYTEKQAEQIAWKYILKIKAIVVDEKSNEPILGASAALLKQSSQAYVKGQQSDIKGQLLFQDVDAGVYTLRISYMGYTNLIQENIVVQANKNVDLGTLSMLEDGKMLGETVRFLNVGQSLVSVGGTATDLLANVPTLQVDMDGTVSLRGSSSVRILIDGKESAMGRKRYYKPVAISAANADSKKRESSGIHLQNTMPKVFQSSELSGTSFRGHVRKKMTLGIDLNLDFSRKFAREGEELTANFMYGRDTEDGTNNFDQTFSSGLPPTSRLNKTSEDGKNMNIQDYFRLYPTAFLTYALGEKGDKIQFSYSRRVQRPRGWQVNPFEDVSDDMNRRQGNPNLLPEDIHSFEMSYAKFYDKWNILATGYYRRMKDVMQPYIYEVIHSPVNQKPLGKSDEFQCSRSGAYF
ncbi:hypothetical protein FQR65_LT15184 [Abscondita terminalis]|nr:hypothetical protein FQR65_LT15184 [Abscondita terminalis]